jgi:hypothetical protein
MPLNYRKPHQMFGAEGMMGTVFQNGELYTMDGRPVPRDPKVIEEKKIFIPDHLKKLYMVPFTTVEPEEITFLDFADLETEEEAEVILQRESGSLVFQERMPVFPKTGVHRIGR